MKLSDSKSLGFNFKIVSSYEVLAGLAFLLFADLTFIFCNYLLYHTHLITDDSFSLFKEYGYPEMFQYWKELLLAALLFQTFKKSKDSIFIIWSLFFFYLFLDDSLKIHERIGEFLAQFFSFGSVYSGGLRGQDFGEIIISGFIGVFFSVSFIKNFYKSNHSIRTINLNLASLVFLLLFFGVFIDFAHMLTPEIKGMQTLEDGGEMVAMSLLLWYAYNLFKFYPKTNISILPTSTLKLLNSFADYFYSLLSILQKAIK